MKSSLTRKQALKIILFIKTKYNKLKNDIVSTIDYDIEDYDETMSI